MADALTIPALAAVAGIAVMWLWDARLDGDWEGVSSAAVDAAMVVLVVIPLGAATAAVVSIRRRYVLWSIACVLFALFALLFSFAFALGISFSRGPNDWMIG